MLDAYPNMAIPAKVSFIATQSQFTPKTVETQTERERLMFRIRVRVDPICCGRMRRLCGRASGHRLSAARPERRMAGAAATAVDVMNRYGRSVARLGACLPSLRSTCALDAVTLEYPEPDARWIDRPGRRRQVVPARHHRRRPSHPDRPGEVLGGDMADPAIALPSARGSPICRRGSARTSIRTSASARISSSSAACSASRRDEREWRIAELLERTGLAPFPDRPASKLSGGMRQKLGLCCALDSRSRPADSRRADHRRRSAVAPAVLGSDRADARRVGPA